MKCALKNNDAKDNIVNILFRCILKGVLGDLWIAPTRVMNTDAPSNSWIDSIVSLKVKMAKGQGVRARSLACNTLGVEGVLEFQDGD